MNKTSCLSFFSMCGHHLINGQLNVSRWYQIDIALKANKRVNVSERGRGQVVSMNVMEMA